MWSGWLENPHSSFCGVDMAWDLLKWGGRGKEREGEGRRGRESEGEGGRETKEGRKEGDKSGVILYIRTGQARITTLQMRLHTLALRPLAASPAVSEPLRRDERSNAAPQAAVALTVSISN